MSYTAPQYVDTKEQAILALASTIKGEAVTGGDGSVNKALDILADVLAEQDVSVPQTDAGAILALAQYASGMVKPEGTIAITENGEGIDVAQYATADVSVSGGGGGGTAHSVKCYQLDGDDAVEISSCVYIGYGDPFGSWTVDTGVPAVTSAVAGTVLAATGETVTAIDGTVGDTLVFFPFASDDAGYFFTMPDTDIELYVMGIS